MMMNIFSSWTADPRSALYVDLKLAKGTWSREFQSAMIFKLEKTLKKPPRMIKQ